MPEESHLPCIHRFDHSWPPSSAPLWAGDNQPIAGIGPVGKITKLPAKFQFTEGPAPDAKGNVYFSDIPKEKIYQVDLASRQAIGLRREVEPRQRPEGQRPGRTRRLRDGRPDRRL